MPTTTPATIIAIGGGGFTHGTDPELEDLILSKCPKACPAIGYIGIANRDNAERIERFYARFSSSQYRAGHLPDEQAHAAGAWVAAQDIIYVGGGNTAYLLDRLRESELAAALSQAASRGVILAGVSAGAVCWFDAALSDSAGDGLAPLPGLGMIAGSCCPHYSIEPQRPPAFRAHIEAGLLPDGIAIDDGVAVLIEAGLPVRAYSARANAGAWRVRKEGDAAVSVPLAAISAKVAPLTPAG